MSNTLPDNSNSTSSGVCSCQLNNNADSYRALCNANDVLKKRYNELNHNYQKLSMEHQLTSRVMQTVMTRDQLEKFLVLYMSEIKEKTIKSKKSLTKQKKASQSVSRSSSAHNKTADSSSESTNQVKYNKDSINQKPTEDFELQSELSSQNRDCVTVNESKKDTVGQNNVQELKPVVENPNVIIEKGLLLGPKTTQCSITDALDAHTKQKDFTEQDEIKSVEAKLHLLMAQADNQSMIMKLICSQLEQQKAMLQLCTAADLQTTAGQLPAATAAAQLSGAAQLPYRSDCHNQAEESWTMITPSNSS